MGFASILNFDLRCSQRGLSYTVESEDSYYQAWVKNIPYVNSAFLYYCIGEKDLDSLLHLGVDLRKALGMPKRDNIGIETIECKFVYKNYRNSNPTIFYPDISFNFQVNEEWFTVCLRDVGKHSNKKSDLVYSVRHWVFNEIPTTVIHATFGADLPGLPF